MYTWQDVPSIYCLKVLLVSKESNFYGLLFGVLC